MNEQRNLARMVFSILRPILILTIIIFYLMGAGFFKYLGGRVDWILFWGGLVCSVLLHCTCLILNTYFDMQNSENTQSVYFSKKLKSANSQIEKKFILSAGLITLSTGSVLIFVLTIQNDIFPASMLVYFVALLLCIAYSVPPIKLTSRGMGEIVLAILISNLYPAFAFLLQSGEMHRLVAIITFPLTLLLLAGFLSSELSTYLQDMLNKKMTLLQVLNWKMGMNLQNTLILFSYLFVGVAVLFGLSWSLTLPFLISLPFSLLSINEVIRIGYGFKPRWSVLLLGSYGAIGCTVYLITFALWTS
jgi:1,4-dihydroxy-2-naphthoate octaprenyltransferase